MSRPLTSQRVQWLPITIAVVCAMGLAVLLFNGVQRAARLQSVSAALQLASRLTAEPQLTRSELTLIQRGLETQTYVGDSLRALADGRSASNQSFQQLAAAMQAAGLDDRADAMALLHQARALWQPLDQGLARLADARAADLYTDSAGGSSLTPAGARFKRSIDELLAAQSRTTAALSAQLVNLAALLRDAVVTDGRSLRALLLGGSVLATLLLVTMLYFSWRAGRAAAATAVAERQVTNILGTVREGLFLIARDGRIGAAHSDSLRELMRAPTPSGQSFEELLRPLADERTLLAATKYLGLLWKDKVNEELIESVNPLSQIEIRIQKAQGAPELRYLSFSFRRVRAADGGPDVEAVLGVVADVTERVLLQRELEQLRSATDSQSTLLLQLLQVEPMQLNTFLGGADAALKRSNALLRAPGKQRAELQQKVQGVFREMHSIKGEAAALGLSSFVQRAHEIEDLLAALRERPNLAGNEFVPVVVKLDALLDHIHDVATLQERVGNARSAAASINDIPPERHGDTAIIEPKVAPAAAPKAVAAPGNELENLLRRLAAEVSAASNREVRLNAEGLEKVPPELAGRVRDICVQMLRNAIVHGIEPRERRAAAGKPPVGSLRVRFAEDGAEDFSLLVEDDGQGLNPEQIRDRARDRGLIDADQAAQLDRSGAFRLLFQPGFSTAAEVSEHAGRGVGLDVVNATIRECGGRIGIATATGKYTRFKMLLPRPGTAAGQQSSAA